MSNKEKYKQAERLKEMQKRKPANVQNSPFVYEQLSPGVFALWADAQRLLVYDKNVGKVIQCGDHCNAMRWLHSTIGDFVTGNHISVKKK